MSLLNDIIAFFIKRRSERITDFKAFPIETQKAEFDKLIAKGSRSKWGDQYRYNRIRSVADFQNSVPVSAYEDLYPYIERILKGERNVLWPSDVNWFSVSSGTTNARSKFIPITQDSLEDCHYRGGKDMLTLFLNSRPDSQIFDGKGLSIGGSLRTNPFNNSTQVGDVSAIIMQNLPPWAQYVRAPSLEVALLPNWEEKMERIIRECESENITSMLGVPTWCVVLMEEIMRRKGVDNMLDVWPNFELFVHGAVAFTPYRELFKTKLFPSERVTYQETYNASEGFFGIQDDLSLEGEMLLMLDYGIFYEFIPLEEADNPFPRALTLDEVELNKNYAMVISTNAGLWRYKIGDTVKFTSNNPFRIKISGRTKHFINAFGEELIIENADAAIKKAAEACGVAVTDYTAAPIFMESNQRGGHEWIIECSELPENPPLFTEIMDKTLREVNSDYDAKRYNDLALGMPKIHFVKQGTFYEWMERRGKLGGQNKVPRLSNSREYIEDILALHK